MKWLYFVCFTSAALAQDIAFTNRVVTFTNLQGTVYKDVTITKADSGGIIWRDGAGGGRTYYTNLSPALLKSWGIATSSKPATNSTDMLIHLMQVDGLLGESSSS